MMRCCLEDLGLDSARTFASDTLYKAAEIIEPDVSDRTIGETIDSFLN